MIFTYRQKQFTPLFATPVSSFVARHQMVVSHCPTPQWPALSHIL